MTVSNQSSGRTVWLAVVASAITGLLGFFGQRLYADWSDPKPSAIVYVVPFTVGSVFSLTPTMQSQILDFISAQFSNNQRRQGIEDIILNRNIEASRESIHNVLSLFMQNPTRIRFVRLSNPGGKRLSQVNVRFPNAIRVLYRADSDATSKTHNGDRLSIPYIEPRDNIHFIVFDSSSFSNSRSNITVNNEHVDVRIRNVDNQEFFLGYLNSLETIPSLIATMLIFFFAIMGGIALVMEVYYMDDNRRRKAITEKQFGRMLGDVEATYAKFRPGSMNPFSAAGPSVSTDAASGSTGPTSPS